MHMGILHTECMMQSSRDERRIGTSPSNAITNASAPRMTT
ncbi:hypothetical protein BRPE64_ACDS14930 [Caballeronia insecticola]|uniref:Uncharacterized protein n=1 Tax=Caballeronia insecticola TaxID=758793 RepID=R4WYH5_9BURK|nr:hypothetical protein BRPE64_ACDS14930 [Caballeronia insecticola]